jgi:hypothetical protein
MLEGVDMDQLAEMLSQKFNLSPEISQQVVQFVFEHLKSNLPEGFGSQLEGLMGAPGAADAGGLMDQVKSIASGMMGGGE